MKLSPLDALIYQDPTCFCQACGFPLSEQPVSPDDWEYVMICPCCRLHYANDDITEMMAQAKQLYGHSRLRSLSPQVWRELKAQAWASWRRQWVAGGMSFWIDSEKPSVWDARRQLTNIGIEL